MRTATERRTGRHHHHVRFVGGGVALAFWFAGWSVSGPAPEPTPGSATCRVMANATAEDYLTGVACPPVGFRDLLGYDPVLVSTSWGWRYTRPAQADGRCSGPLGAVEGVMRFDTACRTHDYGYDLVRFGLGDRHEADELLFRDMMTACAARDAVTGGGCRAFAHWTHTVLEVGDATGFDPAPLAVA
jgi:hypothetical protein